ncbi:hypothetical protein [Phenylobacterium sp.]|uniref:hypothetical protein n=1 Tax=Phenylobacterium sp. TaxID=1871053 RepID=UPI00289BB048|nr:hypothetical protein [Phenylobacterium sp.]
MNKTHRGICLAALVLAFMPTEGARAAKPLINLGPKTAPVSEPLEFAAGDDLSKLGASMIWQNEREAARGLRQVVIPSFQVEFVTHSGAVSTGQSLSQAKVSYSLNGPGPEEMQAITDAFYAHFVADLAAAGVTVIALDEALARSPGLVRLMNMAKPAPYARGKENRSAFYSPPGMKFYFTPNDGRAKAFGDTMTTTGSQVPEEMAMNELGAGVMGVRMVVDFAEIQARGRGVLGMRPPTARVTSKANVALLPVDTQMWVITPKARSTPMDLGHRLRYALTSPVVMPDSVVSAADTTTNASKLNDAVGSAIGVLAGVGASRTRTYEVTVDPQAWSRDVSAAIEQVGDLMIARLKQDL